MESDISIDIGKIPFSRYGAYISLTKEEKDDGIIIHNVQRRGDDEEFKLRFEKDKQIIDYDISSTPYSANIVSSAGQAKIYIRDDRTLVLESDGLDVYLENKSKFGYGVHMGESKFKIISNTHRLYTTIDLLQGEGVFDGPKRKGRGGIKKDRQHNLRIRCEDNKVLLCLQMSQIEKKEIAEKINIEEEINVLKDEWTSFLRKMPEVPEAHKDFAKVTWYNLWSSFVRADDVYKYDAMLMSKKKMCSVWSWDHCFNALAIARVDLQTAIEQFLLPFELQAESGTLPDMWNPNSEVVWGVTKPPIHGWCFGKLMDNYSIDKKTLEKVYKHLEKWTNYWFDYRDFDKDGIPAYPQGCDSGWDNSTLFDIGFFLESPDLSAYLFLQMKTLSRIAGELGKEDACVFWDERAEKLLDRFYEHNWNGERFIAKLSHTHEYEKEPTSLLSLMPLSLGANLDHNKLEKLVSILKSDFLTENGLATEAVDSIKYESDGYWRGPIWAPSTYLLIDGLRRGGNKELASQIARRFCNMVKEKAEGNYENFDALTGEGLRAPGYTWTASVYMLLLWEYLMDKNE